MDESASAGRQMMMRRCQYALLMMQAIVGHRDGHRDGHRSVRVGRRMMMTESSVTAVTIAAIRRRGRTTDRRIARRPIVNDVMIRRRRLVEAISRRRRSAGVSAVLRRRARLMMQRARRIIVMLLDVILQVMAGRVVAEIVRAASFVRLLTDQVDRFVFNNRLARHHISVSRALMVDGVLLESWMNKTHLMSCNRMMDGMVVMVGERVSAGRVASGSSASVWTFIQ